MGSLIVSGQSERKDFLIHPAGVFAARCTRIIDLGTSKFTYEGKTKDSHQIVIGFESAELMGDDRGEFAGKPYLILCWYTASLNEKGKLRPALESWRGRKFTDAEIESFDLKNVLGKPCFLNMIHSPDKKTAGKTNSNPSAIMPLPAGMNGPKAVGDLLFFTLGSKKTGYKDFDQTVFDGLADFYKNKIVTSDEYKDIKSGVAVSSKVPATFEDDDIPF